MGNTCSILNVEASDDVTLILPDEILHQILACIPYPSLIQTKFLNKRLHNIWNTISVFSGSINDLEGAMRSFLDGINHSDPFRHPWRLSYNYDDNGSTLRATVTSTWELHLHFFRPEATDFFHLSINYSTDSDSDPDPSSFHVKSLHLTSLSSYLTSNIVVSSLASSFARLESLHIHQCRMNSFYVSLPELRELTIFDCFLLRSVHVIAPKLVSFRFRGPRPWFFGKGLDRTKLEDAMLDFRRGSHSKYFGKLNLLLSAIEFVECITLFRATYEEIITSEQYARCEKLKLVNLKEIWWIDNSVDKQRINLLLSFLRLCPVVENLFITIDPKSSWSRSMVKRFDRPVKNTRLSRLKLVKIEGCIDEDAEMLLAKALSDSAATDPIIVSRTSSDQSYRAYVEVGSEHIEQYSKIDCQVSECAVSRRAFKPIKPEVEMMILEFKHAHMII